MLKRFTNFFILIIALSITLHPNLFSASTGTLKGKISNAQTKEPLPYSNVILLGTSFGSAADKEGNYIIKNIPAGQYTLRATYIGFKQEEVTIQITDGKTTEYNITLSPEIIEGETVVVTAQAEGQLGAINEQLASIEIKNVVSMAKIRELPDANAAESVSRLPGVSLIRTGGEGSRVVIRGLSPQYNRITIDGVELPGNIISNDPGDHKAEYSSSDELSLSGDRATDLSMISSNSLGGIEVIKAITPDMDATVFGGTVNFSMRKANKNLLDKPGFEIQLQGSHNNLKNTYKDYKTVGSYEQRFLDNSLGIFLQASAEERNLSANQLNANYYFAGKLNVTDVGNPEFQSMSLTDVLRERKRYNGTLVLDYSYDGGNIGFFNFVSRSKTRSISQTESFILLDDDVYYSALNSNTILDVYSNLLSFKQNLFGINIDARLSHSYSVTDNPEDVKFNFWQNGAGLTGKISALKYEPPKTVAASVIRHPEDAVFFDIYNVNSISKDRTLNAGLDLTTDVALSEILTSKFKAGFAYQFRDRSYDYNQSSGSVFYDDGGQVSAAILRAFPQFGTNITASDFNDTGYDFGTFLKGDYTLVNPLDVDLMLQAIEIAKKNPGTGNGGGYKVHKASTLLDDYSGNEERTAGYVMANLNIGQMFTIVPGVRYQNLTTDYTGIRGEAIPGGIQYVKGEETVSHGYWLPMAHVRFKPLDWFQFHFAYTNTLNYPDYNTIIPKYYIGTNFILYNNYRLKPATSENFDVVCSFFTNEIGLFSIGGFKKRIKDLIFTSKTYPKDFSAYPELYDKLKNRTESFTLFTYINNPIPIDVIGMETEWQTSFWYLPEPFNGLVLNVNYTHIFSEAKYPKTYLISYLDTIDYIQKTKSVDTSYTSRLLNQPNDIVNISLGYDYADFSFRVSMLYQDNIFRKPDFWLQNRGHSDKYLRFDLSVKQVLPWFGIQVFFNLNNISGEDDIDINQKTNFITSQQRYGMSADLGIRMNL